MNPQCSFYVTDPSRLIVSAVVKIITEQLQCNGEEWCNLIKMSKREKVVFLGTDKATLHACYQPGKTRRNLMHLAAKSIRQCQTFSIRRETVPISKSCP